MKNKQKEEQIQIKKELVPEQISKNSKHINLNIEVVK
jgi:hypothetical protein